MRWATLAVIYVAFLVWYGRSAEPVSAEQEYQRRVAPLLLSRSGHPLVMVEPAIFLGGVDHKWAALSRSTSMASVPVISFATVRLVPLLILLLIGLLLDRVGARSRGRESAGAT